VRADAAGDEIYNVAVVTALVDNPPADAPLSLAESHFGGVGDTVTAQDDETTPLIATIDLQIVKTSSAPVVGAGGGFDWILDVTNNGPGRATNVVVGDIVPGVFVVSGVTSAQFTCSNNGNTVSCTKAAMAVGETGRITIKVTVPLTAAGGVVQNIGTVQGTETETNTANNSDDADVQIVAQEAPTTTVVVEIPKTGSNATRGLTEAALLLMLLGGGAVLATRRRREQPVD
jgi:LPXTG-motif cell wall-anchored protein/uncharacterized repeat protein (TIGR01451 family)